MVFVKNWHIAVVMLFISANTLFSDMPQSPIDPTSYLSFPFYLILTIFVETAILYVILRYCLKLNEKKLSNQAILFCGIFGSFATLPYLWFVLPFLWRLMPFLHVLMIGEAIAVLGEALLYFFVLKTNFKNSLMVSLACNAASFLIWVFIFFLPM